MRTKTRQLKVGRLNEDRYGYNYYVHVREGENWATCAYHSERTPVHTAVQEVISFLYRK